MRRRSRAAIVVLLFVLAAVLYVRACPRRGVRLGQISGSESFFVSAVP